VTRRIFGDVHHAKKSDILDLEAGFLHHLAAATRFEPFEVLEVTARRCVLARAMTTFPPAKQELVSF
jgi:hypothetical protein